VRRYTVIEDPDYLRKINADGRWWQLGSIARVERGSTARSRGRRIL
jgi:hypothetical protein